MKKEFHTLAVLTMFMAVCGMGAGCSSNGKGAWYNPSSYTYHNPFASPKSKESLAGHETDESVLEQGRPSLDATPNIKPPMGSYTNKNDLATRNPASPTMPGSDYGAHVSAPTAGSMTNSGYPGVPNPYAPQSVSVPYSQQDPNIAMAGGYGTVVDGAYGMGAAPTSTLPQANPASPTVQNQGYYPQTASPYPATPAYSPQVAQANPGVIQPAGSMIPQPTAHSPYGVQPAAGAFGVEQGNVQPAASPFPVQSMPAATDYPASAFGATQTNQFDQTSTPYQYRSTGSPYGQ